MKKLLYLLPLTIISLTSCEKPSLEEEMNIEVKGWVDDKVTIHDNTTSKSTISTGKSNDVDVTIEVVGEWDVLETLEDGTVIYESLLIEDSTQGEGIDIIGSTVYHIDSQGFLVMDTNYQDGSQGDHIYTDNFIIIQ